MTVGGVDLQELVRQAKVELAGSRDAKLWVPREAMRALLLAGGATVVSGPYTQHGRTSYGIEVEYEGVRFTHSSLEPPTDLLAVLQ